MVMLIELLKVIELEQFDSTVANFVVILLKLTSCSFNPLLIAC